MAAKRADYFAAGTLVVWDVDLLDENVVRVFRGGDSEQPAAVYRRGQTAEAEPAVPGWTMPVNDLFAEPAVETPHFLRFFFDAERRPAATAPAAQRASSSRFSSTSAGTR